MEESRILHTKDPYKELLLFASEKKCNLEEIDFKLLSFTSFYKIDDEEWIKANEKELKIFEEDEKFLTPDLKIKQEYKIEIYFKKNLKKEYFEIDLKINELQTLVSAVIKGHGELFYHDKLAMDIFEAIYKQMIKEKLLIGFRIFDFKQQIIELNNRIRENKKFDFEVEIEVSKGLMPKESTNEEVKYHYLEKLKEYNDVMNRNYVAPIGKDEVAIERIKPKEGQNGKDLRFKILNALPPKTSQEKVICSDQFNVVEDDESIKYIAKKSGFIILKKSIYEIENYLEFNRVDFKTTGSILTGVDKQVIVVIKNSNTMDEAVGPRITVEAQELEVVGNLAQDAVLRGKKVTLKGNMHHRSSVIGEKVEISYLRGHCEASELNVDTLENGTIKAKKVYIKKALGGEIIADEIYISELFSNCNCYAKTLIKIDKIQGSGNKLIIQELKIFENEKSGNDILEQLSFAKKEQEKTIKELEEIKHTIHVSKDSVKMLQVKIKQLMSEKIAIPQAYKLTIKDFNQKIENYNNLEAKLEHLKQEEKENISKLQEIQNTLLQAKIINNSKKWLDLNEVKFKLLYPDKELSYMPKEQDKIQCFKLQKDEDLGEFDLEMIEKYEE